MIMKKQSQSGFAHFGLLLLVLVAVVAFAGYKVSQNQSSKTPVASTATPATAQVIPTIKTSADLDTAQSTLNSQNVDGDLNPDSLNQDVSSLL
jgi:uncharacterized protein (UPF0333 family)